MRLIVLLLLLATPLFGASDRYNPRKDTLGVVDGRVLEVKGTALFDTDSTKAIWIDTTITGYSVKKLISFDLRDPNQMWDLARFRAEERNNSLARQQGILMPDAGFISIGTSKDSLVVFNAQGDTVMVFEKEASGLLGNTNLSDVAFQDGVIWATGDALYSVDLTDDTRRAWATSGMWRYKSEIADRNAASGGLLMNASPAIVNNTVNAVAVTRSPWFGHVDEFGRQWPYWAVGTASNTGSSASYDAVGTLSIYDEGTAESGLTMWAGREGIVYATSDATRDALLWRLSQTAITGDAYGEDLQWDNNNAGSELLRWPNATVFSGVAVLPGYSACGNNSPRIALSSNQGLYLLDAKATDNTSGSKREITSSYRSPSMLGDIRVAISGASSADPSGQHPWTESGSPTYVSNTDGPGAYYINLVSASEQCLYIPDHADFGGFATFSAGGWFYRDLDSGGNEYLLSHWDPSNDDDSFIFFIHQTGDLLYFGSDATAEVFSVGPAISTGSWYRVDGTYDGTNQRLYLNGELVDTDAASGTVDNSNEPLALGMAFTAGSTAGFNLDGRLWGWYLTADVASPEWIRAQYQAGLRNMQSPYAGTLHATDVDYLDALPSGYIAVGEEDSVSVMDQDGVILQRYGCGDCKGGGLDDVALYEVPGMKAPGIGPEMYTLANAASIGNEADATTGWTNGNGAGANQFNTFESSGAQKYSGSYSMHFVAGDNLDRAYTTQAVDVGKRYRVSLWYYGTNFDADTGVSAMFGTSESDVTYSIQYGQVNTTWTEVTLDFTASSNTLFITIREYQTGNDADFYIDSLSIRELGPGEVGVAFGGEAGWRIIGPDPTWSTIAKAQWPDHQMVIRDTTIVDSSGWGHFWKPQDGLDAANNVGRKRVHIRAGTYNDPITSVAKGMHISGEGVKTLITNVNSTGNEAITTDNDSTFVQAMAFSTATGGAGGDQSAVYVTGAYCSFDGVIVQDSDDIGFEVGDGAELHTSANAASIGNEADATTGWTNSGMATLESSAGQVHAGSYAMHFVADTPGDGAYTSASVTVGKQYRVSVYYYGANFDTETLRLRLGTAAFGTQYLLTDVNVHQTWTEVTHDLTASGASLFLSVGEIGPNDDADFYIDALSIKEIIGENASLVNCVVNDADGIGVLAGGSGTKAKGFAVFSSGGTTIKVTNRRSVFTGNWVDGPAMTIMKGATNVLVVGNSLDETIVDSEDTGTVSNNEIW